MVLWDDGEYMDEGSSAETGGEGGGGSDCECGEVRHDLGAG